MENNNYYDERRETDGHRMACLGLIRMLYLLDIVKPTSTSRMCYLMTGPLGG